MVNMEISRTNNLEDQKQKIIQFIRMRGPNITMRVSNYLRIDSLIASAFLSDLLSDKALKMSSMKVGNSPIYLIPGQENQLENFSQYLPGKEREAFEILKREKVLDDNKQLPAIRVALRAIKDFAFSFEYNGNVFWRFISVNENDAFEMINQGRVNFSQLPQSYRLIQQIVPKIEEVKKEEIKIEVPIIKEVIEQPILNEIKKIEPIFKDENEIEDKPFNEKVSKMNLLEKGSKNYEDEDIDTEEDEIEVSEEKPKVRKTRVKVVKKNLFIEKVEDYLKREGIEISNVIKRGKKEYHALVSVNNSEGNGKNEYLCIAKEKKSISDKELMKNLQVGQRKNLPVLFVTSGEASKKAVEWLDYLGNVIVYKKMD